MMAKDDGRKTDNTQIKINRASDFATCTKTVTGNHYSKILHIIVHGVRL